MLGRHIFPAHLRLGGITTIASILAGFVALGGAPAEVSAAMKYNCAEKPRSCGYPDAKKTGMKEVIKKKKSKKTIRKNNLTGKDRFKFIDVDIDDVPGEVRSGSGWSWDSRGWLSVTGNGAVLENLRVDGNVDIQADNVTIDNVEIIESGEGFGISLRHANNTRISNCTIRPEKGKTRLLVGIKDIYGDSDGIVIKKCDISGASTAIQIPSGKIKHNYIHDPILKSGDHINGITTNGSKGSLLIYHNTIFNHYTQTDAIGLFQDFGVEANKKVSKNLLAGGGYTLYAGSGTKGTSYNMKFMDNRFSRKFHPNGGHWGPATAYDRSGSGNRWENNYWDETGNPINTP